jgi:hypothetical protein
MSSTLRAIAIGLGDEQPALLVEVDRHGIREHRLGGPELRLHALRQREPLDRELRVVRGGIDDGCGSRSMGCSSRFARTLPTFRQRTRRRDGKVERKVSWHPDEEMKGLSARELYIESVHVFSGHEPGRTKRHRNGVFW